MTVASPCSMVVVGDFDAAGFDADFFLPDGLLAGLRLRTPLEDGAGLVDVVDRDTVRSVPSSSSSVAPRSSAAVERTLDAARVGLRVAQADGDGLADLALEVRGGAQLAFEAGARDLEGVVPGDRVLVVEFARDQPGRQRQRVEGDPALGARGRVERDAHGGAAAFDVVHVELEVGSDRCHESVNTIDLGRCTHPNCLLSTNKAWGSAPRLSVPNQMEHVMIAAASPKSTGDRSRSAAAARLVPGAPLDGPHASLGARYSAARASDVDPVPADPARRPG